ncbi:A disintegrin and metalloproteinase with thrombospondin motifs 9-like isoform X4 [Artemia franciscana]|uniref:A disintegrin and metalloproteinase with thrombospondin motifs 9-like isoform X4 n=1 Tax=Artemia franciscana TaxID=6661 RepID=UPI0032D9CE40
MTRVYLDSVEKVALKPSVTLVLNRAIVLVLLFLFLCSATFYTLVSEHEVSTSPIDIPENFLVKKKDFSAIHERDDIDNDVLDSTVTFVTPVKSNSSRFHYRRKTDSHWDHYPSFDVFIISPDLNVQEIIRAIPDTRQRQPFLTLDLELSEDFILPELKVQYINEAQNYSNINQTQVQGLKDCFYVGSVRGDPHSTVAVNLCHGLIGHIRTSRKSYFIEPDDIFDVNSLDVPPRAHRIYSTKSVFGSSIKGDRTRKIDQRMKINRQRRSIDDPTVISGSVLTNRYVELLVVADHKMDSYHGLDLPDYILTLMSIVQMIYKDPSIGYPITIAVTGIKVVKDQKFGKDMGDGRGKSASEMLRDFCYWQRHENPPDPSAPQHFDTALLLTRENICRNPDLQKCDTLGLAELGTMCDRMSSCSIVQDNGLSAAFTIAHELGHVLNMPHDDDLKCLPHSDQSGVHNVMSRMLDHNTKPWSWSSCSRHYLLEFLDSGYGDCLLDQPSVNLLEERRVVKRPGEHNKFGVNRQCELVFGPGSKVCPYMPECKRLWCTTAAGEIEGCRTQHMPWADGTECGGNKKKYCIKGECVSRNSMKNTKPVDGGWGPWQEWSSCSRTCGGGIQKRERFCNFPTPVHGGNYCLGNRTQYKTCQRQECPPHNALDFRALQCSSHDRHHYNIPGVPQDVKWHPKYVGIAPKDRCKLFCTVGTSSAYYLLAEKVTDGTVCGPDTDDMCVNGRCIPSGCDHNLYSNVKLDMCGVCGGDNSTCEIKKGTFNRTSYGYNEVVIIPEGSSYIDIKQYGYMGTNRDDNYLALKDGNNFILNGNFIVSMFQKTVHHGGTTLEYSGSDAVIERLNSTKPIRAPLVVMVLSVGNLYPPDIQYQYTISRVKSETKYKWSVIGWTECYPSCQGIQNQVISCTQVGGPSARVSVDEHHCIEFSKPKPQSGQCNQDCRLSWEKQNVSECSESCGPGIATIHYQCVKTSSERSTTIMNATFCSHLTIPNRQENCVGPCLKAYWRYGEWLPCTKSCGGGIQRRSFSCHDDRGKKIEDFYCNKTSLEITQYCSGEACPEWKFGEWSPCSVTCGPGYKERGSGCYVDDLPVKFDYCNMTELDPKLLRRHCDEGPCFMWEFGDWSECTKPCGNGQETRKIFCVDRKKQVLPDSKCSHHKKPASSRECNLAPCQLVTESPFIKQQPPPSSYKPRDDDYVTATTQFPDILRSNLYDKNDRRNNEIPGLDFPPNERDRHIWDNKIPPRKIAMKGKPKWVLGKWGQCSTSCGAGERKREIRCYDIGTKLNISKEYCTGPEPDSRKSCISVAKKNCARWKYSQWSPCDVTCGKGVVRREVSCVIENTDIKVADRNCDGTIMQSLKDYCPTTPPCPTLIQHSADIGQRNRKAKANWRTGPWGECSRTCGGGAKRRKVVCQDIDGFESIECSSVRPRDTVPCNSDPCPEWRVSPWKECSRSCGKGIKSRDVYCSDSGGRRISLDYCDPLTKKSSTKKCNPKPCPFSWRAGEWSECSHSCGTGFQLRKVECHRVNEYGWVDLDPVVNQCNETEKPETSRGCSNGDCNARFYWRSSSWSECNARCGKKGVRKRSIGCYNRNGKRVKKAYCPKQFRPQKKEKCNGKPCGFLSCLDIKERLKIRRDGEYMLHVGGKNVSIYCHDMNTSSPREFLTLIKGERDNYSEYYDKRLRKPDSCPYDGARRDDCDCEVVSKSKKPGVTVFSKIRLNVTSLRVITNEFAYAKPLRGALIPFGEAGDCYSTANCPQGRFSINLEGTGFRVANHINWIGHGEKSSLWVNRLDDYQKVQGKCGGFCGKCKPDSSTGLKLDVIPT